MTHTILAIWTILNDAGQWLAIVALGSLVLRQESRRRNKERAIRQTRAEKRW